MNSDIKVSEHLIAFIDILGTSDKLCSGDIKQQNKIVQIIKDIVMGAKSKYPFFAGNIADKLKVFTFSDNILLAFDMKNATEGQKEIPQFIIYAACIQYLALAQGFLVRGAIKLGDLYTDLASNFVCGKGLVEVYNLERNAKDPKIITEDRAILSRKDLIVLHDNKTKPLFIMDKQGNNSYFIDYLQLSFVDKSTEIYIERLFNRYNVDMKIDNTADEKIKSKHIWHKHYFNKFCIDAGYPQYQIEVLDD